MNELTGYQRKYLRGLAHNLKPAIIIGKKGITEPVITEIKEALNKHELIKIKFVDFKEKDQKKEFVSVTGTVVVSTHSFSFMFRQKKKDLDLISKSL